MCKGCFQNKSVESYDYGTKKTLSEITFGSAVNIPLKQFDIDKGEENIVYM